MSKKTFNNPDGAEREYTRELLRLSKSLQRDINQLLLPELGNIQRSFNNEIKSDAWDDGLVAIIGEIFRYAGIYSETVISRLPMHFEAVSKFNERQFKMVVKSNTGLEVPNPVSAKGLLGINVFRTEPYLTALAEGWIRENTALIKSIPTKLYQDLEGIIRRGVMGGSSVKQLASEIKAKYGVTDYRAKLIAQDQILSLNADLTRFRLQSVGVKKYIWRTVNDNRVRPDHREREGDLFSWDKPPYDGHPGQPVRCRCVAEPVFEDE